MNQLLSPSKTKYKKYQKRFKIKYSNTKIVFGTAGIYCLDSFWWTTQQIEAIRKVLVKYTNKIGNIIIKVFPDKPITKKAAGTRMGVGKGSVYNWVYPVKIGQILIEFKDIPAFLIEKAYKQASFRFPVKTRLLYK